MGREIIDGLFKLREELHNRILSSRSLENIIVRPQFERLWHDSTEDQKLAVTKLIEKSDKGGVLQWMRDHPSLDVGEKTWRALITIAKQLGVRNYSRLDRMQLIQAIKEVESSCGV